MSFNSNFEQRDLGTGLASIICAIQNITATDGSLLQYGVSCSDKTNDIQDLNIRCIPINANQFTTAVDNCKTLEKLMLIQALPLTTSSNQCNLQCNKIASATSGANLTSNPGFGLVVGALLFFLIMSFKYNH